jgi:hypothetical protein
MVYRAIAGLFDIWQQFKCFDTHQNILLLPFELNIKRIYVVLNELEQWDHRHFKHSILEFSLPPFVFDIVSIFF